MNGCNQRFAGGERVVYRPRVGPAEEGTVVRVGSFVFVCYGLPGSTPKATRPQDLEHVSCPATCGEPLGAVLG